MISLTSRLWRLRDPRRFWEAASKRLPPAVTSRLLSLRRLYLYGTKLPRFVSGPRYHALSRAEAILRQIDADTKAARHGHQSLVAERDNLQGHIDDLRLVLDQKQGQLDAVKQTSAKTGSLSLGDDDVTPYSSALALADFLMGLLFDTEADDATIAYVRQALVNETPIRDIARTIAIQQFHRQSVPAFSEARHLLRHVGTLPNRDQMAAKIGRFTIIDVGAEPLAFERNAHADLIDRWPSLTLGFDPFDGDDDDQVPSRKAPTSKAEQKIVKTFVGLNGEATFHVNQMRATSSLLPSNLELATNFSLLAEALKTVETQKVRSERLDKILEHDDDFRESVDFLKIDVQGGALDVLKGAGSVLDRTLVCQIEAEFAEVYQGQSLFESVDRHMRAHGFQLLDLIRLGRQRYKTFDNAPTYFFHAGRLLWSDCIYVRSLDALDRLSPEALLKLAIIMHDIYQKKDVASAALHLYDQQAGTDFTKDYLAVADI